MPHPSANRTRSRAGRPAGRHVFDVQVFTDRVSFEVALDRIDEREFAELLLDSFAIRCGRRRADRVDLERYFRERA
jgi:hypothetical protein